MTATIYALAHPETGEIRYIGKTVRPLRKRQIQHWGDRNKGGSHVRNWIRGLSAEPAILPLIVVPESFASEMEITTIRQFRAKGYRLTNVTAGGDGCRGLRHSEETKARLRAGATGKRPSAESRALMSLRSKGRKKTPEHAARISAALKGRKLSPEHIEAMAASLRGKPQTPEHRARAIAGRRGYRHSPETRAKIGAAHVGMKRSPQTIENMRIAYQKLVAAGRIPPGRPKRQQIQAEP